MVALYEPRDVPGALADRHPGEFAYIRQFARWPARELVRNVDTHVLALSAGDTLMPVTLDRPRAGNCYVVSPTAAYTDYARYELQIVPSGAARLAGEALISAVSLWLRRVRLDRIVHVNNWMLSTNLYGEWSGEGLAEIVEALSALYPDRAIVLRSLNTFSNATLLDRAARCGCQLLPSRQIYIQDGRQAGGRRLAGRRDYKQDGRLFAQTGYRVCAPDPDREPCVFDRIESLYAKLYLERYTPLNPQFTSHWLRNGCADGWLKLFCLISPEGGIDGVAGMIERGDTITTPVLGYDTDLPQSLGLYRMLCRICTDEAIARGLALNGSAGAASFKRSRGGVPHVEYSAVFADHLGFESRLAWRTLSALLNRFAAPLLQRYAL
ncbi:MAG TPA: hypothetical protein VKT77_04610 [Chthonomonadaceae bacterium]|nr:hypothetical protein [Chthonomonadaceae bacterium]